MPSNQTYLRPGIYINETLNPLAQSTTGIAGEATAAFAAAYNIGPTIPTFCNSWQTFVNNYGNFNIANGAPLHFAVYSYFANGGTGCWVLRVANTDAVAASLTVLDIETPTPQNLATFTAAGGADATSPGAWGNNVYIQISAGTNAQHVNIYVFYGGTTQNFLVESWLNVSANPQDPRYAGSIINSTVSGSNYITISFNYHNNTYTSGQTDFALISPTQLANGADGVSAPPLGTTIPNLFDSYVQNQILLLNVPGSQQASLTNALTLWAAGREDVFVYVDGPTPQLGETSGQVVTNYLNLLQGGSSIAGTSFAALHAPYLLVQDPSSTNPGATRLIPPSASIMGAQAGVDNIVGVQQAAAGPQYGQLAAVGLEVYFTPTDLNNLNQSNVNAIKLVPGAGSCVFGVRTLFSGFPDMFINVRRVLMKVEHDLSLILAFALFQPNGPDLWSQVQTIMTNYLTEQTAANLFSTTDPSQSFTAICDDTINTTATAQAGYLFATAAVALGSPVEVFVINVQQLNGTTTVTSSTGITTTTTTG